MAKKAFKPEQIIGKLREVEVYLSRGAILAATCRKNEVTEPTCYRWSKAYGGLMAEQVGRLKGLELENTPLKRLVADITPNNAILEQADRENS